MQIRKRKTSWLQAYIEQRMSAAKDRRRKGGNKEMTEKKIEENA